MTTATDADVTRADRLLVAVRVLQAIWLSSIALAAPNFPGRKPFWSG